MIAIAAWVALALAPPAASPPPVLVLETERGAIEIELYTAAAPEATTAIVAWSRAPRTEREAPVFDYIHPHVEIRTAPLAAGRTATLPVEMDAGALGLDRRLVADEGEAMDVLQREILPPWQGQAARGVASPTLRQWIERWYQTYDPSFLVGRSWREIYEALGHRFRDGLDSRPAERGAVALVPASPGNATSRLALLLDDLPTRDGRWLVVGRIVRGLEVVREISIQPVADRGPKARIPRDPVRILAFDVRSGSTPSPGGLP